MQERHDLFRKIYTIKEEIECEIKKIVSYQNSQHFDKQIPNLISQFDLIFKQFPKTIPINENAKPIALKDFYEKLKIKTENRKTTVSNRYSKEIQQINSKFNTLSKNVTSSIVQFIEDSTILQKRFERQINLRKKTYQESIELLNASNLNKVDENSLREIYKSKKINEEEKIIKRKSNELLSITTEIDQLKEQIQKASQNAEYSITTDDQTSNVDIIKQTYLNDISIIQKQIQYAESNITSQNERLVKIKQMQTDLKKSNEQKLNEFITTFSNHHRQLLNQKNEELSSIESKISSIKEKMAKETNFDNDKSIKQIEDEINNRNELIKKEEERKIKEYESQVCDEFNQFYEILNENYEIEKQIQLQEEKSNKNKKSIINQIQIEHKTELDNIVNEIQQYRDYHHSKLTPMISRLFDLQKFLDDTIIQTNKIELRKFEKLIDKINLLKINQNNDKTEFYEMYDIIFEEQIKLQHQFTLLEKKLSGFLSVFLNDSDEFEKMIKLENDLRIEKLKIDLFDINSQFELTENDLLTNTDERIKIAQNVNQIQLTFLSFDAFFELVEDVKIIFDPNDEGIDFLQQMKSIINELKDKFDMINNKINELMNSKCKIDNFYDFLNSSKDFHQIEENQSNQLKERQLFKAITGFTEKTLGEINDLKEIRNHSFINQSKLLKKLKEKEMYERFNSFIIKLKQKNELEEEFMKERIKMRKLLFLNEENDFEFIHALELDIQNLECHQKMPTQQSHLLRKRCLPPLKDA